ncbi:MAG: hypothetical protein H7A40_02155 [Chlamydiales bacterium]|nr:hypothetical protein [Chlamydiales bacterium]
MKTNDYSSYLPVKGSQPDLVSFNLKTPFFTEAGPANVPSTFGLISSPLTLYEATQEVHDAYKNKDNESLLDIGIQFLAQPLNAFYSIFNIAHYVDSALLFFSVIARSESLKFISYGVGLLGSLVCILQGIFECISLKRTLTFRSDMNYDLVERLESINKLANELKAEERPANLLDAIEKTLAFAKSSKYQSQLIQMMGADSFNAFTELLEAGRKEYIQTIKINNIRTVIFEEALNKLNTQVRQPLFRKNMQYIASFIDPSEKQISYISKKFNDAYSKALKTNAEKGDELAGKYRDEFDHAINSIRHANFKRLGRRIQPWLAAEIKDSEILIIDGLKHEDKEIKDQAYNLVGRLLKLTDEQTKKLVITNICGIAAVVFFIPAIFFFPFLVVSTFFGTARYVISAGYLGSRGWEFRKENLVPIFIRKCFRKAKELYKNPPQIKNWKIVYIQPMRYDFSDRQLVIPAA